MEPSCDDGRVISHPAPFVSQVKELPEGNHWVELQTRPRSGGIVRFPHDPICKTHFTEGTLGFAPRYAENPRWWLAIYPFGGRSVTLVNGS